MDEEKREQLIKKSTKLAAMVVKKDRLHQKSLMAEIKKQDLLKQQAKMATESRILERELKKIIASGSSNIDISAFTHKDLVDNDVLHKHSEDSITMAEDILFGHCVGSTICHICQLKQQNRVLKRKFDEATMKNKDLQLRLSVALGTVEEKMEDCSAGQMKLSTLLKQQKLKEEQVNSLLNEVEEKRKLIDSRMAEIAGLKNQNDELLTHAAEKEHLEKVKLSMEEELEKMKKLKKDHQALIELITEGNVSLKKIPVVIKFVLSNLVGKVLERLPSPGLLRCRIMLEARFIANKQIAEELAEGFDPASNCGHTTHDDATTKFHKHYERIQALDATLYELAECAASTPEEQRALRAKFYVSMKNIMADQCSSNGVYNDLLAKLRNNLLPAFIEEFESLQQDEKDSLLKMGVFACRLHLLINFEEASTKALIAFEESICSSGTNPHAFKDRAEPGTKRLARTCASAFTMRGSAVAGMHDVWDAFLQQNGAHKAMGFFYVMVTHPFEDRLRQGSILDLNEDFALQHESLKAWSQDGSVLLARESPLFQCDENKVLLQRVNLEIFFLRSVLESSDDAEFETFTQIAVELLALEILESTLLWWQNRPSSFLESLDEEKREAIHAEASMPRLRAAAKKRKEDLQRKVQLKLQAKANRKEQQEQKAINTRMKASREVFRFGGPWTLNEKMALTEKKKNRGDSERESTMTL
ncbi:hypothetical protein CAPTEDRAFT_211094 [Capitella teleta]|uniref:Uncharacterized protein n=1 Tax=Capitella teleta TaxID=283909 RepID=R7V687_CAPTE|nr:hypothetical protein CAPTEDRAFT_211094 [Capitella teleta]|eukprot:ELU11260.1 hypothetical protein CAPTEDRAFT_211094 [Capitella teleta]